MKSNLWIKRIFGVAQAITLMVTLMAIPSQAGAAAQASGVWVNQTLLAGTLAPIQLNVAGDEKWSGQFALGADGWVFASVFAPNGDLYIGGTFQHVAGISANNVARWDASTNTWSGLGNGTDGTIGSLAFLGNMLYVGGGFTHAGGIVANAIASYNAASGTWSKLGSGMASTILSPSVDAMATDGSGNLYAGGRFETAGGIPSVNIAKWNGLNWSAMGSGLGTGWDLIRAIAVSGSDVYAGGGVSSPAGNLYKYNGSFWSVVGGGTNGMVNALALSGSNLFVGGAFTTVNSGALTVNYVARWSIGTSSWSALGSGLVGLHADAIAVDGSGNVYVTGTFTQAGGNPSNNVAIWNGSYWSRLIDPSLSDDGVDLAGYSLAINGNDVYVGGDFTHAGGYSAINLAHWDAANQHWYAPGNTVNGMVFVIAISGTHVYVGGNFTSAGGLQARSIAMWNSATNTWHGVSADQLTGCNGTSCTGTAVSAIAINGSDIYVGGNFTYAGGLQVNNIARLNGSTWYAMGDGVQNCANPPICSAQVFALTIDGSGVDVGGRFITAAALVVNNIARWDGSGWQTFTDSGNTYTGTNNPVYAVATDGAGNYYIGGTFTLPALNLVYFDGFDWLAGWTAPNAPVHAIIWTGNDVYIGGEFTDAAGSGANYIAVSINGSDWQALGNSLDDRVTTMSLQGNKIFAGGAFTQSGALGLNHIAAWDTVAQSWSNLGSGTDNNIFSLGSDPNYVYVGGAFANAGGKLSQFFGRFGGSQVLLPIIMK